MSTARKLAVRVERPHLGLRAVFLLGQAPVFRRVAHVVRPGTAVRLQADRREPLLHLVGALDADEHDGARAEVQLPADAVDRLWRDPARPDRQQVTPLHVGRGCLRHPVDELGIGGNSAVHAFLHRPVEHEIALVVGEGLAGDLRRRFRNRRRGRRRHRRGGDSRCGTPIAMHPWIAGRIEAKKRLFVRMLLNHGVQMCALLTHADDGCRVNHPGGHRRAHRCPHPDLQ
jgi:hypothetical protein